MKSEGFNAHNKYMILKHALKEKNVAKTCKLFGISRTTFYNWERAYRKHGMMGLRDKEPKKPQMPNKVSASVEQRILSYVAKFPADGPKRVYYEMKAEGIQVGESGIYNVLRRNHLSKRAQREAFAKSRKASRAGRRAAEQETIRFKVPEETYHGYLVVQRIRYMGKFEGIGKIYQYSVYDAYSKWAAVKIYNKKQEIDIWDYFEYKLVYLMKTFRFHIENLVTERSKEFLPYFVQGNKCLEAAEELDVQNCYFVSESEAVFQEMNAFNELLVQDFYNKIGTERKMDSFVQVERALHKFVRHYNFSKSIEAGIHAGKVPGGVILESAKDNHVDLDTLPLWILALINTTKRED